MAKTGKLHNIKYKRAHKKALRAKKKEFKKKDKEFKEHRGGVVPQEYYDSLRGE